MGKNIYDGNRFNFTENGKNYRLVIEYDNYADDPSEDFISDIYCFNSSYRIGKDTFKYATDLLTDLCDKYNIAYDENTTNRDLIKLLKDYVCIKVVYMYDHSGISISTSDYKDPWDSCACGLVCISKEKAKEALLTQTDDENEWYKKASETIDSEVSFYNIYIEGDVYGFELYEITKCPCCGAETVESVDSCYGFYGNNIETNGMSEYLSDAAVNAILND